jgi:hypothetical protein
MRFPVFVALTLLLTTSAWAQGSDSVGRSFGDALCRQKIPCPANATDVISPAALASVGDACVAQSFGMSPPDGVFDKEMGLDGGGCLTVTLEAANAGMSPECCLATLDDDTCTFQCSLPMH